MKTLLIGSTVGLFEAPLDGDALRPELTGFGDARHGAIRAPVLQDRFMPSRFFAATNRSGFWRSDDGGRTWTEHNEGLTYKEAWWLEQHPVTGELFVGTGPVAIFRSVDAGDHWSEIETLRKAPGRDDWFLHIPPYFARVRTISFDVGDEPAMCCALEEGWLIRSRDDGETWDNLRDAVGHDCHVASYVPDVPGRMLASSFQGTFLSDDGGDHFSRCDDFDSSYVTVLNVHPTKSSRVYGAGATNLPKDWRTDVGADTRLFVSDDAGEHWSRIDRGLPAKMHGGPRAATVDPDDPDTYLVGTTDGEIWASRDGGESASLLTDEVPGWVTALSIVTR